MNEEEVCKKPEEKVPEVIASVQSLECSVSYLSDVITDLAKKLLPVRSSYPAPEEPQSSSQIYSSSLAERIRGTQMSIDTLSGAVRRVRDEVEL
ncbi:MAG: hypothetical protein HGA33_00900 [Candidatus Moranbacteria bacterium]|nr:hypothetical protein [Candidatus Moranbacteria bacterium]